MAVIYQMWSVAIEPVRLGPLTPQDRRAIEASTARDLQAHLDSFGIHWCDLAFVQWWNGLQFHIKCLGKTADPRVAYEQFHANPKFASFDVVPA